MGVRIRQLVAEDRPAIREMLEACGAFSGEEVQVALEVLDTGVAGGMDGDYLLFGAEVEGVTRGYTCFGMTPLTRGTWHLYWICVHPSVEAQGVGRALQAHAEAFVGSRGGERLCSKPAAVRTTHAPGVFTRGRGTGPWGESPTSTSRETTVFSTVSL